MTVEVPTTTIPPSPRHQDVLLKMLIEEQRIVIAAVIAIRDALAGD